MDLICENVFVNSLLHAVSWRSTQNFAMHLRKGGGGDILCQVFLDLPNALQAANRSLFDVELDNTKLGLNTPSSLFLHEGRLVVAFRIINERSNKIYSQKDTKKTLLYWRKLRSTTYSAKGLFCVQTPASTGPIAASTHRFHGFTALCQSALLRTNASIYLSQAASTHWLPSAARLPAANSPGPLSSPGIIRVTANDVLQINIMTLCK